MLRIRDVYPGSRIRIFHPESQLQGQKDSETTDPGSASKNLSVFNLKNCFQTLGTMIRDVRPGSRILIFYPSRIPDPGVKKAPDPGPATLQLRLEAQFTFDNLFYGQVLTQLYHRKYSKLPRD